MKLLKIIGLSVLITIVGAVVITVIIYVTAPSRFNVLVIGSDQRGTEQARSDVLMIVSFPKTRSLPMSVLTIPRDTRVDISDYGMQKITHAYALGDRDEESILGNVDLTKETVEQFLGVQIHATAEFTFESFSEIVDLFDGVDTEAHGHLDGEEALEIVRDRFRDGGDFARTADQREIFVNLFDKIKGIDGVFTLVRHVDLSSESRFNYSFWKTAHFGSAVIIRNFGRISFSGIEEGVIPGHGDYIYTPDFDAELYYWVPNEEETQELVESLLKS